MAEIYNLDEDLLVADRVTMCETFPARLRGLLGKRSLAEKEVYWIRPCESIHTFFMLMAIDAVFVDADLRVVKIIENMTPFQVCLPAKHAAGVIEGPVGMIARAKLNKGTQLAVRD